MQPKASWALLAQPWVANLGIKKMRMFKRSTVLQSLTQGLSYVSNNAQQSSSDPYGDKVVLLLHMDGVEGSKVFTDVMGHTVQAVGHTLLSTAKTIAGTAVGYFDGDGDQLAILPKPTSPDNFVFPGDFTIEGKTIFNVITGGAQSLFGSKSGSLYFNVRWYGAADVWQVSLNAGAGTAISTTGTFRPVVGELLDFALVRIAGVIKLYIKGVWTGVSINNSSTLGFSNANAYISSTNNSNYANVYSDEVRVTNGIGRYASNYTPQVGKFPDPVLVLGKGYAIGGWTNTPASATLSSIESLSFANETVSPVAATLPTVLQAAVGIQNSTSGYVGGGSNNAGDVVRKFTKMVFSTETASIINTASLLNKKDGPAGFASTTVGYLAGGLNDTSARTTYVDTFTFSTETLSLSDGSLSTAKNRLASLGAPTKGYAAGGSASGGGSSAIDSFVYSTMTSSMLSAVLSTNTVAGCGISSTLAGYVAGGHSGSAYRNVVDKLVFAGETISTLSATLSVARGESPGPMASSAKGYVAGGYIAAGAQTEIDGIAFATDTAINPSAALASARCYVAGLSSNT